MKSDEEQPCGCGLGVPGTISVVISPAAPCPYLVPTAADVAASEAERFAAERAAFEAHFEEVKARIRRGARRTDGRIV